jgi:HEAT repeat protein
MLKQAIIVLLLIFGYKGHAQFIEKFKKDFEKGIEKDFSEEALNAMFKTYSSLLAPHDGMTKLMANLKGQYISEFPLNTFKTEKIYKDNIQNLLNSTNKNQRILAYLVIAGSGDTTHEDELLLKIKEETDKGCLVWSGMALLHLKTKHTSELFDFLVENEEFGDPHMIPLYLKLNFDSIQQTAYNKIDNDNPKAKILAVQSLAFTGLNPKTENLVRKCVKDWDINLKGYAIFSVRELKMGNLLEIFKPLLDSNQTKKIALQALANSPTKSDQDYLIDLINKQDTVSEDLLDCLLHSKNIENVRYWLQLLYTKTIPEKYYFAVYKQPLIFKNEIQNELYLALEKIQNPLIVSQLLRALANRKDDKSTKILIDFLSHKNEQLRSDAASNLKGNNSDKLKKQISVLIKNPNKYSNELTNLAIENKIDTLQKFYDDILKKRKSEKWEHISIEYLSNFPLKNHSKVFREILKRKKDDFFLMQNAALGLGRLKDEKSVDLIVKVCEAQSCDLNRRQFLIALSMIKTKASKLEIEKYKDSNDSIVFELVSVLLKEW